MLIPNRSSNLTQVDTCSEPLIPAVSGTVSTLHPVGSRPCILSRSRAYRPYPSPSRRFEPPRHQGQRAALSPFITKNRVCHSKVRAATAPEPPRHQSQRRPWRLEPPTPNPTLKAAIGSERPCQVEVVKCVEVVKRNGRRWRQRPARCCHARLACLSSPRGVQRPTLWVSSSIRLPEPLCRLPARPAPGHRLR